MAEAPPTFSESWYRVADQRISLRPGVKARRQFFRGEKWYVLEDPFTNQFFRLRPAAYEFVGRLRPGRTVQQAWEECLARQPDDAPGQEEIIRLVSQLYFAGLLQYEMPADSARLFERYRRRREREIQSLWLNIMFMRIPLLDPDAFLMRVMPVIRMLFSPVMAVVWFGVVGLALKIVVEQFHLLRQQSQGVLAPGNLFLLYLGMVIVKTLHEFGHAAACRRYGGEVHVMGVMLLIFTPTPYMDATSSWGFRSRWQRMLVGAAGMIVELFVAGIATFVWASTGPGTLHNLAYNMMFVASVSTLLFNGNPLLRYDGYYMLSDFLEIPNLFQRSSQQVRYWAERYLFGIRKAESPAHGRREAVWLAVYGVTSYIYRIIVFGGILLFVADRFLILGILMAVACVISWVLVPVGRLVYYLATSPQLERQRNRAIAVTAGFALGLIALLEFVPFPARFRAPGVLEAQIKSEAVNQTAGKVDAVLAVPGGHVTAGQPLVRLNNPELDLEIIAARGRVAETRALIREAMQTNAANLMPLQKRLESVTQQINRLERDQAALIVKARQPGVWVAPEVKNFVGRWLPRGSGLGLVLDPASFYFTATVSQSDVSRLFAREIRGEKVRLRGQAGLVLSVTGLRLIPAGQTNLPSAALGWRGGGEVPVAASDPSGRRTVEPFFEIKASIEPQPGVVLLHGRSGKIRFELSPEPLLHQWVRRLRQVLQKRYQL
ncbi:MAG: hypothetical protein ACYDH9_00580 [Limisphaerales bacterium]